MSLPVAALVCELGKNLKTFGVLTLLTCSPRREQRVARLFSLPLRSLFHRWRAKDALEYAREIAVSGCRRRSVDRASKRGWQASRQPE